MVRPRQSKEDDTRARAGRPPAEKNVEQAEIVETGAATMTQLAMMFQTDTKTLPKRMRGVMSCGTNKRGNKVYLIREAASRIVRPGYEIEEYIRQMSPQELPPLLSKEYWNGQNARVKFEETMGNLWPTEKVVEAFSSALASLRMSILLIQDTVERERALTEDQRSIIQRVMDSAINDCREGIIEKLKELGSAHDLEGHSSMHGLEGPGSRESDGVGIPEAEEDEEDDIGI